MRLEHHVSSYYFMCSHVMCHVLHARYAPAAWDMMNKDDSSSNAVNSLPLKLADTLTSKANQLSKKDTIESRDTGGK